MVILWRLWQSPKRGEVQRPGRQRGHALREDRRRECERSTGGGHVHTHGDAHPDRTTAALLSVAQNVITYGFGSKKDIGLDSPEFFVSTVVDFGVNLMLGLITAGIVAVAVGGITVMGTTFALPVAAVGIASLGIGMLVVSPLFNSANRGLGHLISKDTNISFTEWIKKSWTQRIKDADREAPDISNIGFPDTPNGLAP